MKSIKKISISFLLIAILLFVSEGLFAQCPMCRMTAESNLANGGVDGQGLNNGILLLLATPYLIIGIIAYSWWRNKKSDEELEME